MKITNKTPWRTDHIREIVRRVANQELEPYERKLLEITFVTNVTDLERLRRKASVRRDSTGDVRDQAWAIHQRYKLFVSIKGPRPVRPATFALGIARALLATQSVSLRQERQAWMRYNYTSDYSWAEQFPLLKKPKKKKPQGESLQRHRYDLVLAAEVRWTKKLKAAQRKLTKLRQKRKYYERILKSDGSL